MIYTDFEQIDRDLQILKLERKIDFEKMKLDIADLKNSLSPTTIAKKVWHDVTDGLLNFAQKLLGD
jgi:hypothetical protein